jgi:hypothetical protein
MNDSEKAQLLESARDLANRSLFDTGLMRSIAMSLIVIAQTLVDLEKLARAQQDTSTEGL